MHSGCGSRKALGTAFDSVPVSGGNRLLVLGAAESGVVKELGRD